MCLNYLQNTHDAEEVTQDVFVKIHSKLDSFKAESELKTWVYRIAVNQSLDFLKAKKRKKRFGFHLFIRTDMNEDAGVFSSFDHPGVQLENKEATEHIFKAINQLPERQKTALLLKSMEELSQNEIAEVMELSLKAVESLLSRARANLKEILKNNEG
ncbi:MAG: RNA polymerase sigma factor [Flavobacteriales bacterium]|nr:RNA polymerase sigma factor [Flavobacteriales bacterium]